jgi:hypothetical protein
MYKPYGATHWIIPDGLNVSIGTISICIVLFLDSVTDGVGRFLARFVASDFDLYPVPRFPFS